MSARIGTFVLVAVFAGFLTGCERTTRDTDIKLISVSEVKHLVDRKAKGNQDLVILIDPRPMKYFEAGRLPGAKHLTLPDVPVRATVNPAISRHATIVVYGDDPGSATARGMTKRLMAVGYRGVLLFAGGVKEWAARGYALEGNPRPAEAPAAEGAPEAVAQPGAAEGRP
jgi:3-mercaptopyruvate sulfurtransferase SseA